MEEREGGLEDTKGKGSGGGRSWGNKEKVRR